MSIDGELDSEEVAGFTRTEAGAAVVTRSKEQKACEKISKEVQGYIESNTQITEDQKHKHRNEIKKELHKKIKGLTSKDLVTDSEKIIRDLLILRDARNGIKTSFKEDAGSSNPLMIRDARGMTDFDVENSKKLSQEAFAISVINNVQAAITMLDIAEVDGETKIKQREEFTKIIQYVSIDCIEDKKLEKTYKEYNELIIQQLQQLAQSNPKFQTSLGLSGDNITPKEKQKQIKPAIQRQLNVARQFTVYQGTKKPFDISTISKLVRDDKDVITYSVNKIVDPLSEEGKRELDKIESKDQPGWFTALTPFEQEILVRNIDKMKSGEYPLPTQARNQIALGLRNAYLTQNYAMHKATLGGLYSEPEKFAEYLRQASATHDNGKGSEEERKRLAQLNIERLESLGMTSISDLSSTGAEHTRDHQDKAKDKGILVLNLSLNFKRMIPGQNNYSGPRSYLNDSKELLDGISIEIKPNTYHSIEVLPGKRKDILPELKKSFCNENDPKAKEKYGQIIQIYEAIDRLENNIPAISWSPDLRKKNLDITADISLLNNLLKKDFIKTAIEEQKIKNDEPKKKKFEKLTGIISFNCKSGKDRTAGQAQKIFNHLLEGWCKIKGIIVDAFTRKDKQRLVAAGEHLIIAGTNAGTKGALAIKDKYSIKYISPLIESFRAFAQEKLSHTNTKVKTKQVSITTRNNVTNVNNRIIDIDKIEEEAIKKYQSDLKRFEEKERRDSLSLGQKIRKFFGINETLNPLNTSPVQGHAQQNTRTR